MTHLLIYSGNVDDIRTSMKFGSYSIAELQLNIEEEKRTRNRSTVIQMLTRAINKKQSLKN